VANGVSNRVIKHALFAILAGMLSLVAQASSDTTNFTGHYELVDSRAGRVFTLDLNQTGSRVHITFFAAIQGVPGAKPAGEGEGRVTGDGNLEFTFKDDFGNEGSATLTPADHKYQLQMRIEKFVDPGPLHFYGTLAMKKTSDKWQRPDKGEGIAADPK